MIVTSLMCGGDGLADIVGRRLGAGNPLPWNPGKSWAGSAAMFLGGFGMAIALVGLYSYLGYLPQSDLGATAATGEPARPPLAPPPSASLRGRALEESSAEDSGARGMPPPSHASVRLYTSAAVAAIAGVATVVESLPINQAVDDNLSVPGVTALLGTLMLQVAAVVL